MKFIYSKKIAFYLILAIFFVLLDRFLKVLALIGVFTPPIQMFGDIFRLNLAKNYGIAFSLPLGGWILNLFIVLIILYLVYYWLKLNKKRENKILILLTFIIFGAISNMVDRLKFGFVVDYLDLKWFTVFNLADVMIVGGIILILFINFLNKDKKICR